MIRRLRIQGYKSLRSVAVPLDPLTVLIGLNAAGKSNLFDALGLLSRLATARSVAEAFEGHRGDPIEAFFYGEKGVEGLLREKQIAFRLGVDIKLTPSVQERVEQRLLRQYGVSKAVRLSFLRYEVEIRLTPATGVLSIGYEHLQGLTQNEEGELVPVRKPRAFIEPVEGKLRLRPEGRARPTDYEVGLPYTLLSQPLYPPYYLHLIALREALSDWGVYYFEPKRMREESPLKEVTRLSPSGEGLAGFYYTLRQTNPLQFANLSKNLRMLIPSVEELDVELTPAGRLRLRVKERGVWFSAQSVSEGTLRLLGILAVLISHPPGSVVVLEEPENGVHLSRLHLIAKLLQEAALNRQVLFSTHSSALVERLIEQKSDRLAPYILHCTKEGGATEIKPLRAEGIFLPPALEGAYTDEEELAARIEAAFLEGAT